MPRTPHLALLLAVLLALLAGPPSPAQTPASAEATTLFRRGSESFAEGDLKAAHAAFARLVEIAPSVAAAHSAFGAVLLAESNADAALRELRRAHQLDPADPRTTVNLAVASQQTGHPAEAAALFHSLPAPFLSSPGLTPDEALSCARALSATGDRSGASAAIDRALAGNPGDAVLLDARGTLLAQGSAQPTAPLAPLQPGAQPNPHLADAGPQPRPHPDTAPPTPSPSLAEAIAAFRESIAHDPTLASAHFHLGVALLTTGDPAAALPELQAAQRLGITGTELLLQLGRALAATGQDEAAIRTLREAVAADPQSFSAGYALGLTLQAAGETAQALPLLAAAAARQPTNAAALTNYGLALVQTGDARAAIAVYRRAEAAAPPTPTLREDLGVAFLQGDDLAHSIEQFQAGLHLDPNSANLHYDLGLAYKLQDDIDHAIPEFERAEALDPNLPDPPYTLGVLRMQQGRFPDAQHELERAVELRPSNGDAWSILATVYKQSDQPAKAEDALHHAIPLLPDQPSPHILLATLLSQRGDREAAAAERKLAADLSRSAVSRQRAGFSLESGRTLLSRGDLTGATTQLQAAIAADPSLPEAHLAYAEVLDREGRKADALAERQKAQQLADQRSHTAPAPALAPH